MKKILRLTIIAIGICSQINGQPQNFERSLFNLPDISFKKIETPNGYEAAYELKVKQPLDHFDLSKGFFYQKVLLSHKGNDHPVVLITQGYSIRGSKTHELSELLNANQIDVEHRFFGESKPDSMDYDYLNLKQVTADLHHINQLFKQIYSAKWISTGISKGGVTTILYRYYFPEDVDVGIPYVAPLQNSFEDKRIYAFLDTMGTEECRQKIKSLQVRLLQNRDKVLPLIKFFSKGAKRNFSYLTFEQAFEYAILEYPFTFWQWNANCVDIPTNETSLEEAVEYFLEIDPMSYFTDKEIGYGGPHYYQAATELGYYGFETNKFKGLLKALPTDVNAHATFLPNKMKVSFDGTLLRNVSEWLQSSGDKFIYIYGALDTWSACAVPTQENVESEWFFLKGKHHGTARIANMNAEERQKFIKILEKWISIEID